MASFADTAFDTEAFGIESFDFDSLPPAEWLPPGRATLTITTLGTATLTLEPE